MSLLRRVFYVYVSEACIDQILVKLNATCSEQSQVECMLSQISFMVTFKPLNLFPGGKWDAFGLPTQSCHGVVETPCGKDYSFLEF